MRKAFGIFLGGLFVFSTQIQASGNSSGGGFVIPVNDTLVLADPFAKQIKGIRFKFHPELKEEILRIGILMTEFGARTADRGPSVSYYGQKPTTAGMTAALRMPEFIEKLVLNSRVDYEVVDDISDCQGEVIEVDPQLLIAAGIPEAAAKKAIPAACTEKNLTRFVKDVLAKMPLRELALTIIHERLHSLPGGAPHAHIFLLTTGLRTALELLWAQENGNRTPLTQSQLDSLKKITEGIWYLELGLDNEKDAASWWEAHSLTSGGGILFGSDVHISPDSFVGIGSQIASPSRIQSATVLFSSLGLIDLEGGRDSLVAETASYLEAGRNLKNPKDPILPHLKLGTNARVVSSFLYSTTWGMGVSSPITISVGNDSEIRNSAFSSYSASFQIGSRSKLINSDVSVTTYPYVLPTTHISDGLEIRNLRIRLGSEPLQKSKEGYENFHKVVWTQTFAQPEFFFDGPGVWDFAAQDQLLTRFKRANQNPDSAQIHFTSKDDLIMKCKAHPWP